MNDTESSESEVSLLSGSSLHMDGGLQFTPLHVDVNTATCTYRGGLNNTESSESEESLLSCAHLHTDGRLKNHTTVHISSLLKEKLLAYSITIL